MHVNKLYSRFKPMSRLCVKIFVFLTSRMSLGGQQKKLSILKVVRIKKFPSTNNNQKNMSE